MHSSHRRTDRLGRRQTRCTLTAAALAITLLAGCDAQSNIGIGLVVDETAQPVTVVLKPATTVGASADVTGNATRILAGSVADPLTGTVEAAAFVDFIPLLAITDAYRNGSLTAAELRVVPNYVYGDTTETFDLQLFDVPDNWTSAGVRADTQIVFNPAPAISTPASAGDSAIVVQLGPDWLAANDTTLRSANVLTSFHGFRIATTGLSSVLGFDVARIELNAVSGGDTVLFSVSKSLSTITRISDPAGAPGQILLQDGAGPSIEIPVEFPDSLRNATVNRARIRLEADTTATGSNLPPNFVRPPMGRLLLQGVTPTGEVELLQLLTIDSSGVAIFGSNFLSSVFQNEALGSRTFDAFRIAAEQDVNTINSLFFNGPSAGDRAPRITITLTPSQQ